MKGKPLIMRPPTMVTVIIEHPDREAPITMSFESIRDFSSHMEPIRREPTQEEFMEMLRGGVMEPKTIGYRCVLTIEGSS